MYCDFVLLSLSCQWLRYISFFFGGVTALNISITNKLNRLAIFRGFPKNFLAGGRGEVTPNFWIADIKSLESPRVEFIVNNLNYHIFMFEELFEAALRGGINTHISGIVAVHGSLY